ncbi:diguanylate cyclase/phosphodiesterase with Chase sensor [Stanieria cyanosphaera PCC 7437]|uniref:Diguanylate cyclase/phosphodiesterase with Chase sensor n=1 Tax=Stanieria cyanosphaera (strain ATCC 29371 / PCC 7437) TaxID=111780 RepID=K9XSH5_STAC7|nr:diguanylate cyclase/phosphodiesterase with Chase sensor [Stanieria cyanosphaera PCC 7437]
MLKKINRNFNNFFIKSTFLSGKKKQFKNIAFIYIYYVLFSSLLITGILIGIRQLSGLQILELIAYDYLVRFQQKDYLDPRILVVEITESDIYQQQRWPISDQTIAQLLAKLQQHQPRVIGLDLYRDIPYFPGRQALQEQLQAENVIVIQELGNTNNTVTAPSFIPKRRIGFNDLLLDADSIFRRNLMYVRLGTEEIPSFSLQLSLKYLSDRSEIELNSDSLKIDETVLNTLEADSGGYQMAATEAVGWQILLNYPSPKIAQTITLTEVLNGKFDPNLVKDKVVLIGTTAPSIKDFIYTPYRGSKGIMPGVIAHAQMVSQILRLLSNQESQFWFLPQWVESVWIWMWSIAGGVLVWRSRSVWHLGIAMIASLGSLWGICLVAFTQAGWIPFVPSALAFVITSGAVLAYRVVYSMLYDSLTGLPNRNLFTKQLKQLHQRKLNQSGGLMVVFCLDLDRFKLINDGLGYQAGDQLLITTAQRLQARLNPQNLLARVGGDEFAIAIDHVTDVEQAIDFAKQLEKQLTLPFQLNNQDTYTTVSIGIASEKIEAQFQPEDLLRSAHTAMYQAKVSGKTRHEVFATKMQEQALAYLELEADLRTAIANQEFELYYQPIVSLNSGTIVGFESLVRWHSPQRGFVSPASFIPIAEETGLIIPLGKWILQQACLQMQIWQAQFSHCQSLTISVNLSGRQFSQPNLVEQIEEILQITNLNAQSLKLEITESMVMDDVEEAIILLNRLKALGVRLSMDDFGTGFSSFSYLHRFPMDTLKVDRSFVSNMSKSVKNQAIVTTIITLAHQLEMDVVAEGIETETEMKSLQAKNCEYGQGYFFSKPVDREQATLLITKTLQ